MTLRRVIKTQPQGSGLVSYKIGPSKLYLDDLQMIYDTLVVAAEQRISDSKTGSAVSIEIKAGDASADEIIDLRDARAEEVKRVRISLRDPLVTVRLLRTYADVSGLTTDSSSLELAAGIRDHINSRRSRIVAATSYPLMYLLFMIAAVGGDVTDIAENWTYHPTEAVVTAIGATFVFLALGAVTSLGLAYRFGGVRVICRKENEVRSLSADTRKQLIIAVVGAVIIALAGFWAGNFVHH